MVLKRFVYPASTSLNPSPLRLLSHLGYFDTTPIFIVSFFFFFTLRRIETKISIIRQKRMLDGLDEIILETFRDAKYAIVLSA